MTKKLPVGLSTPAVAGITLVLALAQPSIADEKTTVAAQDDEATRVGTCEDAKAQIKYWCEERAQVTVVSFGMECENAKINAKEACEGIVTEDKPYEFNKDDVKKDN